MYIFNSSGDSNKLGHLNLDIFLEKHYKQHYDQYV